VLLIVLMVGTTGGAYAAPPEPGTPPYPPLPSSQPPTNIESNAAPSQPLDLPPLTAVLVVGPIDEPDGEWTVREKANMELAAAELEANGVTVHRFYAPETDWGEIRAAAEGAHFFLYRGHGVYWSWMPAPVVGGLALLGTLVSPDDLRRDLKLAPNAIVMLYGCFTAGSSSIDENPIPSEEAQRRVAQYSDPFVEIGVAGYYANWFGDAFRVYVRSLFQGMTLGQAYEAFYDFDPATVERYMHPEEPGLVLWLDKDRLESGWQYDNAFAGLPDLTLSDLFQSSALEVTPSAIAHIAGPDYPPATFSLHIDSTSPDPFHWVATVTPQVPWLELHPSSGSNGQDASVVVVSTDLASGTHQATVQIAADDPQLQDSEQTIPVTVHVVQRVHTAYLPLAVRSTR